MSTAEINIVYDRYRHELLGFTLSLAVDFGHTGLTANCVCPGATGTR